MRGKLPQTEDMKGVIQQAIKEAERLNHNYVGTEHLLLAICNFVKVGGGFINAVICLQEMKVPGDDIRLEVKLLIGNKKEEEAQVEASFEGSWQVEIEKPYDPRMEAIEEDADLREELVKMLLSNDYTYEAVTVMADKIVKALRAMKDRNLAALQTQPEIKKVD